MTEMSNTVSYVAAFGGGVASFVSPCVLPIVPGYLSVLTGLDLTDSEQGSGRHLVRIARDTALFVVGFTVRSFSTVRASTEKPVSTRTSSVSGLLRHWSRARPSALDGSRASARSSPR